MIYKELDCHKGFYGGSDGHIYTDKKGVRVRLNSYIRWANGGSRNKHRRVYIKGNRYDVHKLIYKAFHGPIPAGMVVRHVNDDAENNTPENLILGTPKDNVHDAMRNGSFPMGERSPHAKLNEEKVREILRSRHMTLEALAEKYKVSPSTIRKIRNNQTWKHIKREEEII